MAGMRKSLISVEMSNGQVLGPERIIFADKIRLEKTARNNGWDMGRDEFRVQSFLSWAALQRTGDLAEDLGYEKFLEQLIDVQFSQEDPDDDEDPTPADTSA